MIQLAAELGHTWRTYMTAVRAKHQDRPQKTKRYRMKQEIMNATKKKETFHLFVFFSVSVLDSRFYRASG